MIIDTEIRYDSFNFVLNFKFIKFDKIKIINKILKIGKKFIQFKINF